MTSSPPPAKKLKPSPPPAFRVNRLIQATCEEPEFRAAGGADLEALRAWRKTGLGTNFYANRAKPWLELLGTDMTMGIKEAKQWALATGLRTKWAFAFPSACAAIKTLATRGSDGWSKPQKWYCQDDGDGWWLMPTTLQDTLNDMVKTGTTEADASISNQKYAQGTAYRMTIGPTVVAIAINGITRHSQVIQTNLATGFRRALAWAEDVPPSDWGREASYEPLPALPAKFASAPPCPRTAWITTAGGVEYLPAVAAADDLNWGEAVDTGHPIWAALEDRINQCDAKVPGTRRRLRLDAAWSMHTKQTVGLFETIANSTQAQARTIASAFHGMSMNPIDFFDTPFKANALDPARSCPNHNYMGQGIYLTSVAHYLTEFLTDRAYQAGPHVKRMILINFILGTPDERGSSRYQGVGMTHPKDDHDVIAYRADGWRCYVVNDKYEMTPMYVVDVSNA